MPGVSQSILHLSPSLRFEREQKQEGHIFAQFDVDERDELFAAAFVAAFVVLVGVVDVNEPIIFETVFERVEVVGFG